MLYLFFWQNKEMGKQPDPSCGVLTPDSSPLCSFRRPRSSGRGKSCSCSCVSNLENGDFCYFVCYFVCLFVCLLFSLFLLMSFAELALFRHQGSTSQRCGSVASLQWDSNFSIHFYPIPQQTGGISFRFCNQLADFSTTR